MTLLRRFKIQTRLLIQLGIIMFGLLFLIVEGLTELHSSLLNQKSQNTKLLVDVAHSTLAFYHDKEVAGDLSREQAQEQAKAAIAKLRYGNDNYFWIQDLHPRMVMHPTKPALNGRDLSTNEDSNGKLLSIEIVNVVRESGEGRVDYTWPLPGEQVPVDKLSYVKNFEPWGWTVSSGVYLLDVQATFRSAAVMPIVSGLLIMCIVSVVAYLIGRSISVPLSHNANALDDIAAGEGDLTQRLDENDQYHDEAAFMAKSFNAFVSKIEQTIVRAHQATKKLGGASTHLRNVLESNSRSMEQQKHESQAVVTAITEMASTANEIAKNSEGAATSASEANKEADSGRKVVGEAIAAVNMLATEVRQAAEVIDSLNTDSQSISSVLDVIRGIAEQTNLLALNAAIEAARAGEQGRGFAVVADEVRTLAARTQTSTEEIRQMIESLQSGSLEAVTAMQRGEQTTAITVTKAEEAGHSLENIVNSIKSITDMNMQIASAAEEQSLVAQEIDRGIHMMADLNAQSASEIETAFESSRDLEDLSASLGGLVEQFKISG